MKLSELLKKLGSGQAPAAASEKEPGDASSAQMLEDILKGEAFSYDPEKDEAFSAYKSEMEREGKRASENVMGIASSLTGGTPSSYAVTAASQAAGEYSAAEKLPDFYEAAYKRYQDKYQKAVSEYKLVKEAEEAAYEKEQDDWKKKYDIASKKAASGDTRDLYALGSEGNADMVKKWLRNGSVTREQLEKLLADL